jgi:hypothetical protein
MMVSSHEPSHALWIAATNSAPIARVTHTAKRA